MEQSKASYFVAMGILSGLGTIVGFSAEYGSLDAGQPEFATVLILIIGVGFILTGWLSIREQSRYRQVPALFLGLVGLASIVGSVVVFQPWQYEGLAGGLRYILVACFTVIGVVLIVVANRWIRQREVRYPLAILSCLLAVGLFYLVHQRLDLNLPIPLLAVLVALIAILPMAVLHVFDSESPVR